MTEHDNGREEQWRLEPSFETPYTKVRKYRIATGDKYHRRVIADSLDKADADAILAARAQAGLAQRLADDMRERGHKAQFNNPTLSPRAALAFALTGAEWEWLAEFDALAAVPTAAAEVNDGE